MNKAHKKRVKAQYDKTIRPRIFFEDDHVLVYDQGKDTLGAGKFKPIWYDPYIVKNVLNKGVYELVDSEGNVLLEPKNGLFLKNYYA